MLLLLAALSLHLNAQPDARGFRNAALILKEPAAAYYLVQIPSGVPNHLEPAILALHTPPSPSTLILPVEPLTVAVRNEQFPGFRYSTAAFTHFDQQLFPALVRYNPQFSRFIRISILHYIDGVSRTDTETFLRQRNRTHPRAEYEQPAAVTHWERPSNTAPWRPGYEKYGLTGDPDPDNRFRAADLRPSVPSASTPLATLTPTPVQLAQERQQHAAQQLAKARQKDLASRRPGVVYKSRRFWSKFPAFDIPRHVFNGHGIAAVGPNLGNMARFHLSYMGYVENFQKFCAAYIPPPPQGVTVVITDPNDRSRPPQYVAMDRRFAANFMTYGRATRAQVGAFVFETFQKAVQSPPKDHAALTSILFSSVASSLETAASWTAFFQAVPCNSATMRQMGENFLLASNMQPSLQAGGAPGSPLAAKESDTLQAEDINTPPDGPELQRQVSEAQVAEAAGEGLPLRIEQLHSFRRVHYVDLNNMSAEFARLIGELDDAGQNVIHCSYGPTAVLANGEPQYKTWVFWYRLPPLKLQSIINSDPQGKLRRDLRHVVPACPPTSRVAAALQSR